MKITIICITKKTDFIAFPSELKYKIISHIDAVIDSEIIKNETD